VEHWEETDISEGEIYYNHYDPDERLDIEDIRALELTDKAGNEINIYDTNGYRIPRRQPIYRSDTQGCGLLADLSKVHKLFTDDDGEDIDDHLRINVYPQAFTRQYGHFQANDVPIGFHPIITAINRQTARFADSAPVVRGVACQGYNNVQHCLTEKAGSLEIVEGKMTAAFGGANVKEASNKLKQAKLVESISRCRPHGRIAEKLSVQSLARAFRVEPVFVVDVQQLKRRYQCGGYVRFLVTYQSKLTLCVAA
jgi:hypothetical protein